MERDLPTSRFGVQVAIYALVTCVLLASWAATAFAGVAYVGQLWPWPVAMLVWGAIVVLDGRASHVDLRFLTLAVNIVIYSVMNALFATGWEANVGQPLPAGFPFPVIPILAWGAGLLRYAWRVVSTQPSASRSRGSVGPTY